VFLFENGKRLFRQLTGQGMPTTQQARALVREHEPKQFSFTDDGSIPNNAELPLLFYKDAADLGGAPDPAAVFEVLFGANGWGSSWRNGIYEFVHYHSGIHEVLGIARGNARVRFGGSLGSELELGAGDVAVLPAGTGHQCLGASRDFLVVGAYPPEGKYDLCRGSPEEHERARRSIRKVPVAKTDPLSGANGPLTTMWRSHD
jgi:uncharacterized protein YjlB